jgi:hypothetical protein
MESILTSIKKLLGIDEEYTHFDSDLIMHINTTFMILSQLGVGKASGFSIVDDSATWSDYLQNNQKLESIKTYIYLKVKLIFDPPISTAVIEAINRQITELEWRLNVEVDVDVDEILKEEVSNEQ